MTDAVETVGQDMHEEAADELLQGRPHDAGAPAAAVVPVGECDFIVIDGKKPGIGDSGLMCAGGTIGQDALRPAEGRLGVGEEALAQVADPLSESAKVCERGEIAEEASSNAGRAVKPYPAASRPGITNPGDSSHC
jgi:hypothetical protein